MLKVERLQYAQLRDTWRTVDTFKHLIERTLDRSMDDFITFVDNLSLDAKLFRQNCSCPMSQTFRRAYVRAVFSMIDGVISTIKRDILVEYDITDDEFLSTRERHILEGKVKTPKKDGVVTERPFFAPLAEDVWVTIKFFAYFNLVEHYMDKETRGWKQFRQAIGIRHRIAHPKTVSALEITDQELAVVDAAQSWFIRNIALIYEKIGASLLAQAKALRKARPLCEDYKEPQLLHDSRRRNSRQLALFSPTGLLN